MCMARTLDLSLIIKCNDVHTYINTTTTAITWQKILNYHQYATVENT